MLDFCLGSVFFLDARRSRISFADRFMDKRSPPFACAGAGSDLIAGSCNKQNTHGNQRLLKNSNSILIFPLSYLYSALLRPKALEDFHLVVSS